MVAIALDAADWERILDWSGRGFLPNLKSIMERGSYCSLANHPLYRNESPWVSLLTGCTAEQTGYWTPLRFSRSRYRVRNGGGYSFHPYRPFYVLPRGRRVTVFDLPHCGRLFSEVDGVQVLGWGAHSPMGVGQSRPAELFGKLQRRFGPHPARRMQDHGSWWDGGRLQRLRSALLEGLRRRGAIMEALLDAHPADLSVLAFSELHIAGHHFWHLSDPGHPSYGLNQPPLADFLLEIYRETDRVLGDILQRLPANANLLVFSPEGGAVNWCDLNSMVFLPEILFRWNFPGQSLLAGSGGDGEAFGPVAQPRMADWVQAVWHDYYSDLPPSWLTRLPGKLCQRMAARRGINFPFYLIRRLGVLQWQPPVWYRPWWPRMKAFALPSYGDGCIRINLKGREPQGMVAPSEYKAVCSELSERLRRLRDPRTGKHVVSEIILPREHLPGCPLERLPDADMVVLWQRQANDMIEAGDAGRLGPLPFWKSGSHRPTGFVLGLGPDIPRQGSPGQAHVTDLASTILGLLDLERPGHMSGREIFA